MSDDVFVRDSNNDLAVNTVVSTEANVPYNYDDCFTVDTNGRRALRVVGSGGGGDQHNLGYYATQAALEEAHPTAEAGDWAIVGTTDTVWIWDTDNSEWKDSDQKGQVTSVNGETGDVVLNLLPTQTGNAGKFLTTDGTDANWSDKPLVNNATNNTSVSILGNATDRPNSVVIGKSANLVDNGGAIVIGASATGQSAEAVCIGNYAQTKGNFFRSIAIGYSAETDGGLCIAIGSEAKTYTAGSGKNNSIAIGNTAQIGTSSNPNVTCAMQFGKGTNTESGTVCFGLSPDDGSTWTNYKLLDSNGTVPTARLTKVNSTITLTAAGWSSNTQTVSVTGMTATGVVLVSPDPTDQADYTSAGIYCSAQSAGSLEFTCTNTPTNDIDVVVVML